MTRPALVTATPLAGHCHYPFLPQAASRRAYGRPATAALDKGKVTLPFPQRSGDLCPVGQVTLWQRHLHPEEPMRRIAAYWHLLPFAAQRRRVPTGRYESACVSTHVLKLTSVISFQNCLRAQFRQKAQIACLKQPNVLTDTAINTHFDPF